MRLFLNLLMMLAIFIAAVQVHQFWGAVIVACGLVLYFNQKFMADEEMVEMIGKEVEKRTRQVLTERDRRGARDEWEG